MRPEEFIKFINKPPLKNKWIVVTNNINAKNAHGEMSHVWLTNRCIKNLNEETYLIFDDNNVKVQNLTHYKYV